MEFERMMRDPEDIQPTFQPNSSRIEKKRRKMSADNIKIFIENQDIWKKKKEEKSPRCTDIREDVRRVAHDDTTCFTG